MAVGEETVSRVACRIFQERGYHATSMRAIASALGMQPAALYYYYESKEKLLYSIMDRAVGALAERVRGAIDASTSPHEQITQAIRAHILSVSDHLDELTVFLNETKALGPGLRDHIQAERDAYERIFRDILEAGVACGDFTDVDPRLAGFLILSACNWLYQWYKADGAYRPEEIAAAFSDMILRGLARSLP